jgi:hypothetical protein
LTIESRRVEELMEPAGLASTEGRQSMGPMVVVQHRCLCPCLRGGGGLQRNRSYRMDLGKAMPSTMVPDYPAWF